MHSTCTAHNAQHTLEQYSIESLQIAIVNTRWQKTRLVLDFGIAFGCGFGIGIGSSIGIWNTDLDSKAKSFRPNTKLKVQSYARATNVQDQSSDG